jgi:hypothetical protein
MLFATLLFLRCELQQFRLTRLGIALLALLLCAARESVHFRNPPSFSPDQRFVEKSLLGFHGEHPAQR